MFKLLIADDFFVERENVKDILLDSNLPLSLCGEVSNGQEALEFISREEPDFVLADIEMPIMNGLDLADEIRKRYPRIKVIFFSFYSKFEYARKAIDLEAYAYILKPIVKEEMIGALGKIIREKKQELQKYEEDAELRKLLELSRPLLIDKLKRDLFHGLLKDPTEIWERLHYFQLPLEPAAFAVLVAELDDYTARVEQKTFEEKEMLSISIATFLESIAGELGPCLQVRMEDARWAFLLNEIPPEKACKEEKAWQLAEKIIRQLQEKGISVSVGISCTSDQIGQISKSYEQALHALDYKFHLGKRQIIRYGEICDNTEVPELQSSELQKALLPILHTGSKETVDRFIDELFTKLGTHASEKSVKNFCFSMVLSIQLILTGLNISFASIFGKEGLIWEKLIHFETILDIKQWLKNIILSIAEYLKAVNRSQFRRIVEDAQKVIQKHYSQGITVRYVADALHYNPNYLNNIFKQETGITILEYITQIRVEAAKKLLVHGTGIKMYELSEAVGYSHESYFKSVFKQYTGMTPREYRDKMKQELP